MGNRDMVNRGAEGVETLSEVLGNAGEALGKIPSVSEAINKAVPWLSDVGDWLPPLKFVANILKRATRQDDPNQLGYIACQTAYLRSMHQAFQAIGGPATPKSALSDLKTKLKALEPAADINFKELDYAHALQHPFVVNADRMLDYFAENIGYTEPERRKLRGELHVRFVSHLKTILSHGETREQFTPFRELIEMQGGKEALAYGALLQHADYQRRQYEELPVLDIEPFALQHVYIPTECGVLKWKEIDESRAQGARESRRMLDPFSEHCGGRHALLDKVLELFGDAQFKDAIVIQGPAGAGKSSFTLRLCAELVKQGLKPIRIRLRDMHFDRSLEEDMERALRLGPEGSEESKRRPEDIFLGMNILKEEVRFGAARICPYVWILDGWDEITLSASEDFSKRVSGMLEKVRSLLLGRAVPVRVVLTGRPSEAVTGTHFFRGETRLLSMRAMRPEILESYVEKVRKALKTRPVKPKEGERWKLPEVNAFQEVFKRYAQAYEIAQQSEEERRHDGPSDTALDVLGLPLLAHLSLRLMSGWTGKLNELIENPTTLYRNLIDLTCEKSGQPEGYDLDPLGRARISGLELRSLLRRTAAAMSILGQESIAYEELELRLNNEGLDRQCEQVSQDHRLTHLMVSFYFKGGHKELGCEFLHKSFREYLFAEEIVETLKRYGREQSGKSLPERPDRDKDFPDTDPRYRLSRELSKLLAPQWIRPEVDAHLRNLLSWEIIERNQSPEKPSRKSYTERLPPEGWKAIRDALADLWGEWTDGLHLKPKPKWSKQKIASYEDPPRIHEMMEEALPFHRKPNQEPKIPTPIGLDARLGDALCRLCAAVHWRIAQAQGWVTLDDAEKLHERWLGISDIGKGPRRHQTRIRNTKGDWVVFAPSGPSPEHFAHSMTRINAWASRPSGPFPIGVMLLGADLRGVSLQIPISAIPPKAVLRLEYANMSKANISGASFRDAYAWNLYAPDLQASGADLRGADFFQADLRRARLKGANLQTSDFRFAILSDSELQGADLSRFSAEHANFERADLRFSQCESAQFLDAKLEGAHFENASLLKANFEDTSMHNVRLSEQQRKEAKNLPNPNGPPPPVPPQAEQTPDAEPESQP